MADTGAARVVVDARALQLPLTGIGRYVQRLLAELPPGMTGVARPSAAVEPSGLTVRTLRPDAWNVIWNEVCLRRAITDADAFWSTVGHVPRRRVASCRVVATIHDVIHRTDPHTMSIQRRLDLENSVRVSVRNADVLAVTCDFVSAQLERLYGRRADLIVAPAPTVSRAHPTDIEAMRGRLHARHPAVRRWVLAVGQEVARKNFIRLADAVARLPDTGLVIAGPAVDPEIAAALDQRAVTTPLIRFGYADDDALAVLYAATDALAFVSLLEGFGMPLLDARSLGTRLVVADAPPMPDHAGPQAVVVDGRSVESIAAGLLRALDAPAPAPEVLPTWGDGAARLRAALGLAG